VSQPPSRPRPAWHLVNLALHALNAFAEPAPSHLPGQEK